jgi:hypothetical protein
MALLVPAPRALSQGTIAQVLTNGPTDKRINIVFLSEGYQQDQTNAFAADARNLLNMLRTPPFDAYSNYFNAFTIFVASAEAGSDHPSLGVLKNTYFNSSYDSYGTAYLITIPPNDHDSAYANGRGKVDALLESLMPEYDLSMLVVNDTEYGGSGGSPLIVSVNANSAEIAVHEMGHTFSALGDEYDAAFPAYPDTEEPNTTRETNRTLIKWRDWILPSTPIPTPETAPYAAVVGLFEGAHYHATDWYRPKLDCKMNHLRVPFCDVCSEALVKSTYELVRPIDSNSPPTNAVITLVNTQAVTLMITRPQPVGYDLNAQWFTNNVGAPGATNGTFTIVASALPPGTNQVRVEVTDPTSKVRTDPMQVLKDSRTWRITAQVRPMLEARRSQNSTILSWPASATGFVLEFKTDLSLATPWLPVGGSPAVVSNRFTMTDLTTGDAAYYRLRQ